MRNLTVKIGSGPLSGSLKWSYFEQSNFTNFMMTVLAIALRVLCRLSLGAFNVPISALMIVDIHYFLGTSLLIAYQQWWNVWCAYFRLVAPVGMLILVYLNKEARRYICFETEMSVSRPSRVSYVSENAACDWNSI